MSKTLKISLIVLACSLGAGLILGSVSNASVSVDTLAAVDKRPVADFIFAPASPAVKQAVQFTDTSTGNVRSRLWKFGNGKTSTAKNPSTTYANPGTKTVRLTVTNRHGSTTRTQTLVVVAGGTAPAASFSFSPAAPAAGQTVQFTDTSTGTPTSWAWDFNDGTTAIVKNPSHAFVEGGAYSVTLTATNATGSDTDSRVVNVVPPATLSASFTFTPLSPVVDEAVQFADTSSGGPTAWAWTFGDGAASAVQHPSHAYGAEGTYTVTLIVTNPDSTSSASLAVTVTADEPPPTGDYDWLIIDRASRLYDWTYAGVPGGIPARTTIYQTLNPGASATQINAAISSCPSGQVVYLAAGTYSVGRIDFGSENGVTLRGAGAGTTILNISSSIVNDQVYYGTESTGVAVSAGYEKGSTEITVASGASFVAGSLVAISENPGQNKWGTGVGVYNRVGFPTGSTLHDLSQLRSFRHVSRIVSKTGNVLTIATPLPLAFAPSLSPKAYPLNASAHTTLCGIEDLTINAQNNVDTPINWYSADRCWVKGVELKNVPGSDIGMIRFHGCTQCEIRRCYIHDATGWPNQADGYATSFNFGTSNCLIVDCITYKVADLCETNGADGCAYLYNYGLQHNRSSEYARGITLDHGPHGYMNLAEGNVLCNVVQDGYHGSTSHGTMFRNHLNGENMAQPKILNLCRGAYYFNVVGNVLGRSGWNPLYYEQTMSSNSPSAIYVLGFPTADSMGLGGYTSVPWTNWSKPTNALDADVKATLLRHGNYDYFNHASVWDAAITDREIPASLVYTSKPAWFGALDWPAIGPDVAGLVKTIPAKARWDAYAASGRIGDLF